MTHCRVGHEIAISGRTKWGACSACYAIRFPGGERLRHGICIRGHDTTKHGRNKSGECNPCRAETNRRHAWKGFLNQDGAQFTSLDYDRVYQIQGGKCAICRQHQSEIKKTLEVDHDHDTMLVRGLLCCGCNMHLGKFEQIRERAEKYLKTNLSHNSGRDVPTTNAGGPLPQGD